MPAMVRDGRQVLLRPVRAEDAAGVQSFVRALSPQSRYRRFFSGLTELTPYMLRRLTQPVYPTELGLVALAAAPGESRVVGMAQYALEKPGCAELGVAVADAWQRQGLGTRLLQALADHASCFGIRTLCGVMLADNQAVRALLARLGWTMMGSLEAGLVRAEKALAPAAGGGGSGASRGATSERAPHARASGATPPAACPARA